MIIYMSSDMNLLSWQYFSQIMLVFQISCLTCTFTSIIAVSLSQVLDSVTGVTVQHNNKQVFINRSLNQQNWSFTIFTPLQSIEEIRNKRDETENLGSAYGRGVGFFVGEPCETTCNKILFHVLCNHTTHLCQCLPDYPIKIDNKICVKAARLGEACEYKESCIYSDTNSICGSDGKCQCSNGYYQHPINQKNLCISDDSPFYMRMGSATYQFFYNADIITLLSLIASLVVITALLFFVFRLFKKERQNDDNYNCYGRDVPPVVLTDSGPSILNSRCASSSKSVINDYLPPSRRGSYSLLAPPPSKLASRSPSMSSIRSQSSFRSYSSFRSQSTVRNYREGGCNVSTVRGNRDIDRSTESPADDIHLSSSNPTYTAV